MLLASQACDWSCATAVHFKITQYISDNYKLEDNIIKIIHLNSHGKNVNLGYI